MCSTTRGKPLFKYLSSQSEEEICKSCPFLPTKPETIPDEIVEAVSVSLEFAEIERGGGKFAYPDALTSFEWACLRGLVRGRDKAENLRQERERKEPKNPQN